MVSPPATLPAGLLYFVRSILAAGVFVWVWVTVKVTEWVADEEGDTDAVTVAETVPVDDTVAE